MTTTKKPDLTANLAGIVSPNPFWLASAPPTNTYGQVARAFDNGWGGAVWKTIGQPIVFDGAPRNVGSPPPMLGDHSRPVLLELGYAAAEVDRMAAAGVIVDGAR